VTDLVRARTAVLWYQLGGVGSSDSLEVVPAGNRVCLRAYASYQGYLGTSGIKTRANFRTTSDSSTPVFSDIVPQISWLIGMASLMVTVEIPGSGVLFHDGLFIDFEQLDPVTRTSDMKTLLQVVYS